METGGVATACAAGCLPPGVGVAIAKMEGVVLLQVGGGEVLF